MPDVFLSYSRSDGQLAHRLVTTLQAAGVDCWIDDSRMEGGEQWLEEISASIGHSRLVVLLLTANSAHSQWVQSEIAVAREHERPVFVAGPENIDLPAWVKLAAGARQSCNRTTLPVDDWLAIVSTRVQRTLNTATPPPAAAPAKRPVPRNTCRENLHDRLPYVWVAPGEFVMGAHPADPAARVDERPARRVRISAGFWISATPITIEAYCSIIGPAPHFAGRLGRLPATGLSWDLALAYCRKVGGDLPTEAQWEYAARSSDSGPGSAAQSLTRVEEVGVSTCNSSGMYNVLGFVWEWCSDFYDVRYYASRSHLQPDVDPQGPPTGRLRVVRGGSYRSDRAFHRHSARAGLDPGMLLEDVGFRCVISEHGFRAL